MFSDFQICTPYFPPNLRVDAQTLHIAKGNLPSSSGIWLWRDKLEL